jgi:ribosomal protein S18 acetylase RimI-like enzyme
MVAVNLQVRRAVPADHQQIANLMFFETHVHRHLDWRAPLDWLGSPYYWVLEEQGEVIAALACPQDPPGVAWIRLFTCASPVDATSAWYALWGEARREVPVQGRATIAAIAIQPWFEDMLVDSGFIFSQNIIMLTWDDAPLSERPLPSGVRLRSMLPADLPAVVEVDAAAFEPLWRNSLDALQKALGQASYATVAESSRGLVGYQLSTGSPTGAHLARLAVRPEAQGTGLGSALVNDLLRHMKQSGRPHVTVNTQSDNFASQALYQRLGFILTGEQFPVFIYPV